MKKLLKILSILFICNLIFGMSIIGYVSFTIIRPSIKGTGITVSDFFKLHLDPAEYELLEKNLNENSSKLGKEAASKIIDALNTLLPSNDIDFSDMPEIEYPYPDPGDVVDMVNENTKSAIEEGLRLSE